MFAPANPLLRGLLFLLLLAPAALTIAENTDMPLLGYPHDDGLYWVTAKSIHDGNGYRIASLPEKPFQTKYPPALPYYMSLAWAINPEFPANLKVASWLQFLWLPLALGFAMWHWGDWSLRGWRQWALGAWMATNAFVHFFASTVMTELPFTALVLASLWLLRKSDSSAEPGKALRWVAAAGLVGGLAFLMRTAGIALLVAVPAALWFFEKRKREAMVFAGAMLNAVVAWTVWAKLHQSPGDAASDVLLYYTNYVGYHFSVFHWSDAHLFVWRNLDSFLASTGSLIMPGMPWWMPPQASRILTQVMGVAAIAGSVRLVRDRKLPWHYPLFALISALMLLVWSFPPTERFVLPLAPLFWGGFLYEMSRVAGAIRNNFQSNKTDQKVAGAIFAALGIAAIPYAMMKQFELRTGGYDAVASSQRERLQIDQEAYQWVRQNLPPESRIISAYDPVFYLHTGRPSALMVLPVTFLYRDDDEGRVKFLSGAPQWAKREKFDFIYLTPRDHRNDIPMDQGNQIHENLAKSPDLELVQRFKSGLLYRVK